MTAQTAATPAPNDTRPEDVVDLIVVGAGINGVSIARDAAARVALVERKISAAAPPAGRAG